MTNFLNMVVPHQLDGFWIHFDVLWMDDTIMPAVDSRQQRGLNYDEIEDTLSSLLENHLCTGMEIIIPALDLDRSGNYTKGFVSRIGPSINKALQKRFN